MGSGARGQPSAAAGAGLGEAAMGSQASGTQRAASPAHPFNRRAAVMTEQQPASRGSGVIALAAGTQLMRQEHSRAR